MKTEYECLVQDVAGPAYHGFCHLDTAMDEAENECDGNYGMSLDELLEEVGKTKADLRMDAIKLARKWNQEDLQNDHESR